MIFGDPSIRETTAEERAVFRKMTARWVDVSEDEPAFQCCLLGVSGYGGTATAAIEQWLRICSCLSERQRPPTVELNFWLAAMDYKYYMKIPARKQSAIDLVVKA